MIPASALEALPPSRRASILYGAAQAELSQRWPHRNAAASGR